MTRTIRRVGLAALLLGLTALPACGKDDDKQTNPTTPELNSGDIGAGGTYVHTFTAAGTFPYHCTRHPNMTGTVTVNPSGSASETVSIVDMTTGYSPAAVTVAVGGSVTWTNNDSQFHTVTSH